MFRERKVNTLVTPDSVCDLLGYDWWLYRAVVPLLARFIPHAECNVSEPLYPDYTRLRFGKSWVHRSKLWSYLKQKEWRKGLIQLVSRLQGGDRRWFAKPDRRPNVALYILQKSMHLWDDTSTREHCARPRFETARSAGSTAPTELIVYSSMFWERKVNTLVTPDRFRGAVLTLLAWFIPHAECNVSEPLYPDCTQSGLANLRSIGPNYNDLPHLNGETILNFLVSHQFNSVLIEEGVAWKMQSVLQVIREEDTFWQRLRVWLVIVIFEELKNGGRGYFNTS